MHKLKNISILTLAIFLIFASIFTLSPHTGAIANCVSDECKAAEEEKKTSEAMSSKAKENATLLAAEIETLEKEIVEIEGRIEKNQEIADSLAKEIEETTAKLLSQQEALAKLLVEIHFEDQPDAISMLAGSKSLSDFSEKQARAETVRAQISLSANAVKHTKEELENKKAQIDQIIADAEAQRAQIDANRKKQEQMKTQYEEDAETFDEKARAAQKIMAEEIAKEIAKNNATGRVVASGTNSYPYQNRCPQENWYFTGRYLYGYGGYICECTSYAGYKAYEYYGVTISSWGNAKYWGNSALAHGYTYDSTPEAHTVGFSTAGTYGHVVWIETVNSDGTVDLSEYNNSYSSVSGSIADFGYRTHVPASSYKYIHFR